MSRRGVMTVTGRPTRHRTANGRHASCFSGEISRCFSMMRWLAGVQPYELDACPLRAGNLHHQRLGLDAHASGRCAVHMQSLSKGWTGANQSRREEVAGVWLSLAFFGAARAVHDAERRTGCACSGRRASRESVPSRDAGGY
jgi:hypothetical protein